MRGRGGLGGPPGSSPGVCTAPALDASRTAPMGPCKHVISLAAAAAGSLNGSAREARPAPDLHPRRVCDLCQDLGVAATVSACLACATKSGVQPIQTLLAGYKNTTRAETCAACYAKDVPAANSVTWVTQPQSPAPGTAGHWFKPLAR
jgi:hypothetical protein